MQREPSAPTKVMLMLLHPRMQALKVGESIGMTQRGLYSPNIEAIVTPRQQCGSPSRLRFGKRITGIVKWLLVMDDIKCEAEEAKIRDQAIMPNFQEVSHVGFESSIACGYRTAEFVEFLIIKRNVGELDYMILLT